MLRLLLMALFRFVNFNCFFFFFVLCFQKNCKYQRKRRFKHNMGLNGALHHASRVRQGFTALCIRSTMAYVIGKIFEKMELKDQRWKSQMQFCYSRDLVPRAFPFFVGAVGTLVIRAQSTRPSHSVRKIILLLAVANEDTMCPCLPPRETSVECPKFVSETQKTFLNSFKNIFYPQQMFPRLLAQENMSHNVSSFAAAFSRRGVTSACGTLRNKIFLKNQLCLVGLGRMG